MSIVCSTCYPIGVRFYFFCTTGIEWSYRRPVCPAAGPIKWPRSFTWPFFSQIIVFFLFFSSSGIFKILILTFFSVDIPCFGTRWVCVPLSAVSTALAVYYYQVFSFTGKAVSVFFFYHAGLAVENLDDDWQLQLQDKRLIGSVWNKYQVILRLVDRANQLFGPIIIVYDFYTFVMICIDAYQLFLCLKYQREIPGC